jgi:hypothetical protein
MTLWLSEHASLFGSARPLTPAQLPALQTQQGSTVAGALSTFFLSTNTTVVRVISDATAWLLLTSSGSASNATSTGIKISANVPEYFTTPKAARLSVLST